MVCKWWCLFTFWIHILTITWTFNLEIAFISSAAGESGNRLCILGASSGVGTLAVQMGKAENMIITATCGTDFVEMVKNLGADYVIDYTTGDLIKKFRGQSFDVILDCTGLGSEYAPKLPRKFGQYITLMSPLIRNTDSSGVFLGLITSVFNFIKLNIQSSNVVQERRLVRMVFFKVDPVGIAYLRNL